VAEFWYTDCGHPVGVRSVTQADLVRLRVSRIREQFDACMYSALTCGGFGLKSSYLIGWDVLRPIEAVATASAAEVCRNESRLTKALR
jgi:hypothetical protein